MWGAIACALAGVVLIQQPHFDSADTATFDQATRATLVILAGSVSTAVAMLGLNRLQGIDLRDRPALLGRGHAVLRGRLFCFSRRARRD